MHSVVHLIPGDESEQETALGIARNLLEDERGAIEDVVVVAQAGGIEAVTTAGSHEETVRTLLDDGVSFMGCRNTLEMTDIDESALVDGVETVPEGAVEVTRLQTEGYGYLRP